MITANRRPNVVIRRKPSRKKSRLSSMLMFLPLKPNSKQASNLTRLTNPLPRKIRMPKRYRSPQKTLMNACSENVTNVKGPTRWRTSMNSPEFTSSTTRERGHIERPAKHRKSTKSAARSWQKKRPIFLAFSNRSTLKMTRHSRKSDQSQNSKFLSAH